MGCVNGEIKIDCHKFLSLIQYTQKLILECIVSVVCKPLCVPWLSAGRYDGICSCCWFRRIRRPYNANITRSAAKSGLLRSGQPWLRLWLHVETCQTAGMGMACSQSTQKNIIIPKPTLAFSLKKRLNNKVILKRIQIYERSKSEDEILWKI